MFQMKNLTCSYDRPSSSKPSSCNSAHLQQGMHSRARTSSTRKEGGSWRVRALQMMQTKTCERCINGAQKTSDDCRPCCSQDSGSDRLFSQDLGVHTPAQPSVRVGFSPLSQSANSRVFSEFCVSFQKDQVKKASCARVNRMMTFDKLVQNRVR